MGLYKKAWMSAINTPGTFNPMPEQLQANNNAMGTRTSFDATRPPAKPYGSTPKFNSESRLAQRVGEHAYDALVGLAPGALRGLIHYPAEFFSGLGLAYAGNVQDLIQRVPEAIYNYSDDNSNLERAALAAGRLNNDIYNHLANWRTKLVNGAAYLPNKFDKAMRTLMVRPRGMGAKAGRFAGSLAVPFAPAGKAPAAVNAANQMYKFLAPPMVRNVIKWTTPTVKNMVLKRFKSPPATTALVKATTTPAKIQAAQQGIPSIANYFRHPPYFLKRLMAKVRSFYRKDLRPRPISTTAKLGYNFIKYKARLNAVDRVTTGGDLTKDYLEITPYTANAFTTVERAIRPRDIRGMGYATNNIKNNEIGSVLSTANTTNTASQANYAIQGKMPFSQRIRQSYY